MRFSTNLKKCLAGLMLGGLALWFAGCGESSSTPMSPSGTSGTSPKVNSDGSVKSGDTAGAKSAGRGGADKTGADDEQAGSSTGGREVPLPADEKDEAK